MGITKKMGKLATVACLVSFVGAAANAEEEETTSHVISQKDTTISGSYENGVADSGGYFTNTTTGTTFDNASFYNNYAKSKELKKGAGGAIVNQDNAEIPVIKNSTFKNNTAYGRGGAVGNFGIIKDGIINTIFQENKTTYVEEAEEAGKESEANKTQGQGGALYNYKTISGSGISGCTFTKN